jgi:hypothetical protein
MITIEETKPEIISVTPAELKTRQAYMTLADIVHRTPSTFDGVEWVPVSAVVRHGQYERIWEVTWNRADQ